MLEALQCAHELLSKKNARDTFTPFSCSWSRAVHKIERRYCFLKRFILRYLLVLVKAFWEPHLARWHNICLLDTTRWIPTNTERGACIEWKSPLGCRTRNKQKAKSWNRKPQSMALGRWNNGFWCGGGRQTRPTRVTCGVFCILRKCRAPAPAFSYANAALCAERIEKRNALLRVKMRRQLLFPQVHNAAAAEADFTSWLLYALSLFAVYLSHTMRKRRAEFHEHTGALLTAAAISSRCFLPFNEWVFMRQNANAKLFDFCVPLQSRLS